MSMELEVFKDIPGYKAILRAVLKSQIQLLVKQLSEHTGDESLIITANVTERSHSNLGSIPGNKFLQQNTTVKQQFLNFCLGHHDGTSRFTQNPAGQSPRRNSHNVFKLKPEIWKTTLRRGPYFQKAARRALKSPAKPMGSKGQMFENGGKVGQTEYEAVIKIEDDSPEVKVSPSGSPDSRFDPMISGQGHLAEVEGHSYALDNEEGLVELDGEGEAAESDYSDLDLMTNTYDYTLSNSGNQSAVTVATDTSVVTRSNKRKSAMPTRRYQDPYPQLESGTTTLLSSNSGAVTLSPTNSRGATLSPSNSRPTTLSPSPVQQNSNPTPSHVFLVSTKKVKQESQPMLALLPGHSEVVFPEPRPALSSSPAPSPSQASNKPPARTPQIDGLLVSRGEGRYEKLIRCEICGKVCRTSNMARHRKQYCLLSPSRRRGQPWNVNGGSPNIDVETDGVVPPYKTEIKGGHSDEGNSYALDTGAGLKSRRKSRGSVGDIDEVKIDPNEHMDVSIKKEPA